MELDGKRVILLTENMFNDLEFWYPYYRLKEAGGAVTVVGSAAAAYTGKAGTTVTADAGAEEVAVGEFDALVIPGGYAPDLMRRHPAMVALVRDCFLANKPLAAICHAGWMLASAKILAGRRVTSFFAIKDDLVHAGAEWVDAEVVVDGNLITSRTPDDLPVFMRAILEVMGQGGA
jgi:protease I